MKRNNFSRAINHLKKGGLSESGPTNSMKQVYSDNRGGFRLGRFDPEKIFYPDVDGNFPAGIPAPAGSSQYVRPAGYWDEGPGTTTSSDWDTVFDADFTYNTAVDDPRNTDNIIDKETGFVRSPMPPNSRSFILGPLVDSYFHNHGYDNLTRIGYIQKDTREFVQLGYINGRWGNDNDGDRIFQDGFTSGRVWNGQEASFVATNEQFTFAHLQWFHDQLKEKKYIQNAHFFFSGGVSTITGGGGTGQPSGSTQGNTPGAGAGLPKNAANNGPASMGAGSGGTPNVGTPQDPPGFDTEPNAPYPNPKANQGEEGDIGELVELGLNALNIGLDILAVAAIIFPEPGTSAAGLARLATRVGSRVGSRAMSGARNRAIPALTRIFKGKPKYRPTKARYGGGSTKPDPMDRVLRDIDKAGKRLQQQPRDTNFTGPRGAEVRGPYSDVKAQSRPGSGKYQSQSRNYDPKNNPSFGSRRGTRRFNESFLYEVASATPTMAPTTPAPTGDTPPSVETLSKVNKTAENFADEIVNKYSADEAADLAVKAEGDAILIASQDPKVQEALVKAYDDPSSLTSEEKQILINNGYDDFVRGGMKGTDLIGDLLTLGLSAAAAYALWPLILKAGGSFVDMVKYEWSMRGLTDAAMKTFETTGQMPPWYHWAFWKIFPQPVLNAFARISGSVPAKGILHTEGTKNAKIALHYILKPAAFTSFFQLLLKGDQSGAEKLLENSMTDTVKQDIESGSYELLFSMFDSVGEDTFMKLTDVYGDQKEGFNEKNDRLEELTDPEYLPSIQSEIDEIQESLSKYGSWVENGEKIYLLKDWGGQFTKQNFESSGQSFEEYDALREQIGFFNGERGPDEYGRYIPISWKTVMDARENGHKPEQFTGIAYEIVSRSYKMDEIYKNPNYPRQGRNIYNNEADYLEASKLQDEYQKILGEYINLWEGPGGFDDISDKAWDFERRSNEMWMESSREAHERKKELRLQMDNAVKERKELSDEVFAMYDEIYTEMLVDYLLEPPANKNPDLSQSYRDDNDQEIAGLRPDGTNGPNKVGDTNRGHDGTLYKLVPRPGYGYNMWVPVKLAEKDDPNTPLGSTDPTTLATTGYERQKKKKKKDDEIEVAAAKPSGPIPPGPRGYKKPGTYDPNKFYNLGPDTLPSPNIPTTGPGYSKKNKQKKSVVAHHEPQGRVLSERKVSREKRRKILREVKQSYVLPEVKVEKYKPNFKGKFRAQNTPDVTASKQSDDMVRSKNSAGQVWRTKDKYWAGYETTERMNVLQDRTGHGQMYFDSITSSNAQDYEKITERFRQSMKDKDLQEHLNTIAHEKAMRGMQNDYISPFREKKEVEEQQTMQYDNDPLMKKVAKKLKSEIDYFDKPSKLGYPNDPPPKENELINGMHPQYGKKVDYYKKLDPHSAEAMPPTGDPDIDAEVQKARRLKPVKSVSNNASPKLETPLKKRTKKKT